MNGYSNGKNNARKETAVIEYSSLPKTGLFLEERLFLNKSRTKWLSIGAQPMPGGEFIPVVRLCENESKFVTFTRDQIPHLFNTLDKNESSIELEILTSEKWWESIVGEAPPKYSSIHFKVNDYKDRELFEIGNKKSETFPFYIILGQNSIKNLYERNKLIWKMVNEVKINYIRMIFSDLIRDAKETKDTISEHLIWKAVLEKDAIRYCGANSKNSTIARDALTHGFEYFKHVLEQSEEENALESD